MARMCGMCAGRWQLVTGSGSASLPNEPVAGSSVGGMVIYVTILGILVISP